MQNVNISELSLSRLEKAGYCYEKEKNMESFRRKQDGKKVIEIISQENSTIVILMTKRHECWCKKIQVIQELYGCIVIYFLDADNKSHRIEIS